MSDEKKREILYAHYKDVVANRRSQIRSRYRYLLFILVVVVLILLQLLHPKLVFSIFAGLAERFLGTTIADDFPILETILLFIFMLLITRYLQIAVGIERSYNDTNFLEEKIRCKFGVPIKTEGKAYAEKYPTILNLYDLLYKIFIPLGLLLIAFYKFWQIRPITVARENLLGFLNLGSTVVIIAFVSFYWWFCYSSSIKRGFEMLCGAPTETAPSTND